MKASDRPSVPIRSVTPDYFQLLRLQISQGRDFRSTDVGAQRGHCQSSARGPLFSPFQCGRKAPSSGYWRQRATEIICVVPDGRTGDLTKTAVPEIYLPFWQAQDFPST